MRLIKAKRTRSEPREKEQGGMTLVELSIVVTIMVPILAGIAVTTKTVNSTMVANTRAADAHTHARRMGQRVGSLLRPAKISSIKVQAVAADVTALRATTVGEWIDSTDLIWRPGIEFLAASGLLSMNAALSTSTRRISFALEAGETANGVDDDGDGLVDEGEITMLQNGNTLAILREVEECSFSMDGRVLSLRLRVARSDRQGVVYRSSIEQRFYLRNN
ncbi:MAG: hypothetical protein ACYTG5_14215 [Planctomycetota bacterium]|jgi:hypothetical protein